MKSLRCRSAVALIALLSGTALSSVASAQVTIPAKPTVEEAQQAATALKAGSIAVQEVHLCLPAEGRTDAARVCLVGASRAGREHTEPLPMRFEQGHWRFLVETDARGNVQPANLMPACAPPRQMLPLLRKASRQPDLEVISGGPNTNANAMFVRERAMSSAKGPYRLNCIYAVETADGKPQAAFTYQDQDGANFIIDDYVAFTR